MPKREEVLYQDFSQRLLPRPMWDAQDGTALRQVDKKGNVYYVPKPKVAKRKHRPTEAEDNAEGRAIRRRHNRMRRQSGVPHAAR